MGSRILAIMLLVAIVVWLAGVLICFRSNLFLNDEVSVARAQEMLLIGDTMEPLLRESTTTTTTATAAATFTSVPIPVSKALLRGTPSITTLLPTWTPFKGIGSVRSSSNSTVKPTAPLTSSSRIISRDPAVTATCDVRGNLGPCSVVIQSSPGKDWIKDRWQAASDMGGTSIPGTHFILLDFQQPVFAYKVVIDWETAFAEQYRLEVIPLINISCAPTSGNVSGCDSAKISDRDDHWDVVFDGSIGIVGQDKRIVSPGRTTTTSGQSPGVKQKMPLHVVHTILLPETARNTPFRFLRLFILKPAAGWGVSVWQFDVFGATATTTTATTSISI